MGKFKVGDKIIGNKQNKYLETKEGWVGVVIKLLGDGFIEVKNKIEKITYSVHESCFDLYNDESLNGPLLNFEFVYSEVYTIIDRFGVRYLGSKIRQISNYDLEGDFISLEVGLRPLKKLTVGIDLKIYIASKKEKEEYYRKVLELKCPPITIKTSIIPKESKDLKFIKPKKINLS